MTQAAAEHDSQMLRLRDAEDAFERAYRGRASEQDWEHIAWEMGILDHWKRIHAERKTAAVG